MAATKFTKTGGWDTLEKLLDDKAFNKKLAHNIKRANKLNGLAAQRAIRQGIKAGGFAPNAALTVAIKGSSKPLVDTGAGLFQAITVEEVDPLSTFIGVKIAHDLYDVAVTLHDGVTIEVTPAMRRLFWVLWKASVGDIDPAKLDGRARELWDRFPGNNPAGRDSKGRFVAKDRGLWKPISEDTKAIIIPPRPFIRQAFAKADLKAKIAANWEAAVKAALQP